MGLLLGDFIFWEGGSLYFGKGEVNGLGLGLRGVHHEALAHMPEIIRGLGFVNPFGTTLACPLDFVPTKFFM